MGSIGNWWQISRSLLKVWHEKLGELVMPRARNVDVV